MKIFILFCFLFTAVAINGYGQEKSLTKLEEIDQKHSNVEYYISFNDQVISTAKPVSTSKTNKGLQYGTRDLSSPDKILNIIESGKTSLISEELGKKKLTHYSKQFEQEYHKSNSSYIDGIDKITIEHQE